MKGVLLLNFKKIKRIFIGLLVLLSICSIPQIHVIAEENYYSSEGKIIQDEEIYFNGEYVGRLLVREESYEMTGNGAFGTYPLSNKTYDVRFIGISANIGYKVDVRNGKIVNAYGLWHWGILWKINPSGPFYSDYDSYVKGTTSVGLKDFSYQTTFTLRGYIGVDNQFHTTVQAP